MVVLDSADRRLRHPEKAHRPDSPVSQKPDWIRVKAPGSPGYAETRRIVRGNGLHTVCVEAKCPNIGECWSKKHATFMILGDTCTRACAFCNVKTGLPGAVDHGEPERLADAVAKMGLKHVVVTSVDRDDLDDGGAGHFAAVIRAVRARSPETTIEVLTPDFLRKDGALEAVVEARPDVFNHNLETVPSLYLTVRPGARYFHSIRLLQRVKELDPTMFTKSGIMVGLGERPCQGLSDGLVFAADALVASCRRRFCQTARRPRGPARPLIHAAIPNDAPRPPRRVRYVRAGGGRRALSGIRAVVRIATGAAARGERGGDRDAHRQHDDRLQNDPGDLYQPDHPRPAALSHHGGIPRWPFQSSRQSLALPSVGRTPVRRGILYRLRVQKPHTWLRHGRGVRHRVP